MVGEAGAAIATGSALARARAAATAGPQVIQWLQKQTQRIAGKAGTGSGPVSGASSEAAKRVTVGTTRLFQAVSEAEFSQLMKTGKFEVVPSSVEGKYFAETADHARRWGEKLFGGGKFRVVQVDFPDNVASQFFRWEKLDNMGPARFAEMDQLFTMLSVRPSNEHDR